MDVADSQESRSSKPGDGIAGSIPPSLTAGFGEGQTMLAANGSEGYLGRWKFPHPIEIPRMPAELSLPVASVSDLPPRTWRGWWLARPKWFRIGCWAALGLALLHVALAVRIAIGLIEDPEISRLRAEGGEVFYPWRDQSERFECDWLLNDGLMGRSAGNVYAAYMPDDFVDDPKIVRSRFPNIKIIVLFPKRYVGEIDLDKQYLCHRLRQEHNESEPVFYYAGSTRLGRAPPSFWPNPSNQR